MSIARRRRPSGNTVNPEAEAWLRGAGGSSFPYLTSDAEHRSLWSEHGADIVAEWAGEHPSTRPPRWWQYDAPEPRRRLGGVGTASHECTAYALRLWRGVPADWITAADLSVFRSIGHPLDVPPVDLLDPPKFESEAAFLDRHGLLLEGERRRLPRGAFTPERIAIEVEDMPEPAGEIGTADTKKKD